MTGDKAGWLVSVGEEWVCGEGVWMFVGVEEDFELLRRCHS